MSINKTINNKNIILYLILFVLLLLQAVKVYHCVEYILMDKDFNQVHLSQLFMSNDIPAIDDGEVGDNVRYFALSNFNFLIPLVGAKFSINPLYYIGLQMLLIVPLIFLGVYLCANAIFNNKLFSAFAGLLFLYNDFWLFKINIGYPILINNLYYYNDIVHAATVFLLYFMLKSKYIKAAFCVALGTMINPTHGINLSLLLVIGLLVSGRMRKLTRENCLSILIISLASFSAWWLIKLATPIYNPAPLVARIFAIRIYAHIVPHVNSPFKYFVAISLFLCMTALIVVLERIRRFPGCRQVTPPSESRVLARSILIFLFVQGIVCYWILYIFAPTLIPVIAPSKSLMIVAIYLVVYIAYMIYIVFLRTPKMALLFFAPFILMLLNGYYPALPYSAWALIVVLVILCIWIIKHDKEKLLSSVSNFGLACAIILLLCDVAYATAKPFIDKRIDVANALYDISLKINKQTEASAVFVSYRLAGTHVNTHGTDRNMAFRTYSRRAIIPYQVLGRNAYFNSLLRHENEERAYAAAGLMCWKDLEDKSERMKNEDSLAYYVGVSFRPAFHFLASTALNKIFYDKLAQLRNYTTGLNFGEYMAYAKRLGASYLIVSHDKGAILPSKPLIKNEYFSVYKIK